MESTLRQLAPFILAICLVGYWYYDRKQSKLKSREVIEEEYADSEEVDADSTSARKSETVSGADSQNQSGNPADATLENSTNNVVNNLPQPSDEDVRQKYTQALKEMASCLDLSVSAGESRDMDVASWVATMKPQLGEPVLQTEDSSFVDLQTSSGEKRRILIEMDYSGEERIVRRVKYFKLNDGQPGENLPMAQEQTEDPSDTFLASLESDGQVVSREKNERVYFASGEEIVVSERNGRIANIEVNRNGRSFRCRPTEVSQTACECLK